ncbi:MAG TPA: hypothetical protein VG944_15930, partial [Fimbriimonas sp.]|nr:hypothetical protein [Fimbriimonas sp.]
KVSMVFSQAGVQFVEDQALERTTQALLKVLEYKAKNGSYPARLSQVGNWIDPFTGRPLCMVVNGASIKVYSVGPDRIDNKGADRSQVRSETGWDLVSQSPPPKRALRK